MKSSARSIFWWALVALFLFPYGDAQAPAAHETCFCGLSGAAAALGVLSGVDDQVTSGAQVHTLVSQHVGAFDVEVLTRRQTDAFPVEVTGERLVLLGTVV